MPQPEQTRWDPPPLGASGAASSVSHSTTGARPNLRLRSRGGNSCVAVVLLVLLVVRMANAQAVSEYQVKAAYLYNFAKFVEWPAQKFTNSAAPFQLCVLDDASFIAELNRLVQGRSIAGRAVKVIAVQSADEAGNCHVLFVSSSRADQVRHSLEVLSHRSVLTVGETKNFCDQGGIINFVLQDDRVQFEVNHKAANAAGLQISSRLLSVAKLVFE